MSRELLFSITKKDLKIDWFSGTGAGGQKRNKCQNSCRITHRESNVTVTGQSHKERPSNIREAFNNLQEHPKFKLWFNQKVQEVLTGKTIEQKVEEQIHPDNLKVEGKETGRWEKLQKEI